MPIEIVMVDGTWLLLNDEPTDNGGTVTTLSDITDMKRNQVELSESEQRFRDFTSAASDWVWELDADARFVHIGGRYSEVSGQTEDKLLGRRFLDMPSEGSQEEWTRLVAGMDARQPFRNVQMQRSRQTG